MIKSITEALARKRSTLGKEKGFTLIELLVVVIIIGILAAIAIPIFLGQQASAKGSSVQSAIANAKVNVVAGIVDGSAFPTTLASGDGKVTLTISGSNAAFCILGKHSELTATGDSWAADDKSGVIKGKCTSNVAVP